MQQTKSNEAAQKEIEEAVNRVKEAQQSMIAVTTTPDDIPGNYFISAYLVQIVDFPFSL